jgi:hypothetical protein
VGTAADRGHHARLGVRRPQSCADRPGAQAAVVWSAPQRSSSTRIMGTTYQDSGRRPHPAPDAGLRLARVVDPWIVRAAADGAEGRSADGGSGHLRDARMDALAFHTMGLDQFFQALALSVTQIHGRRFRAFHFAASSCRKMTASCLAATCPSVSDHPSRQFGVAVLEEKRWVHRESAV